MNIELKGKETLTALTVACLIEELSKIEDKEMVVTVCEDGYKFQPLTAKHLNLVGYTPDGETEERMIMVVNGNAINGVKQEGDSEQYNILEDAASTIDSLEYLGNIVSDMQPQTEDHCVVNLDSLSSFHKHKARAIRNLADAVNNVAIMGDIVMIDEEMEMAICPGCENCNDDKEAGGKDKTD